MGCTDLIRVTTSDGFLLEGLLCTPGSSSSRAVLHVHGLAGNFYFNLFIDHIAAALNELGIAFLSINTRGHDSFADLHRTRSGRLRIVEVGAAYDNFVACKRDILAFLDLLEQRGFRQFLLQGHSTGALKVAHFLASLNPDNMIKGAVFLSPSDDVGLQKAALGNRFEESLVLAAKLVTTGEGDEIMPDWAYSEIPISAKTYLQQFRPGSAADIFGFAEARPSRTLRRIRVPVLCAFGSKQEAVVGNEVRKAITFLKRNLTRSPSVQTEIIEGSPHSYLGYEAQLAKIVSEWSKEAFYLNQDRAVP